MGLNTKRVGVGFVVLLLVTSGHAQAPNALRDFFDQLPQRSAKSELPSTEELQRLYDRIPAMSAADIRSALPVVDAALSHRDEYVCSQAAYVTFLISKRADAFELLRSRMGTIGSLVSSSSDRVRKVAALTLLDWTLPPSDDLLQPIVAFLNRTDREPAEQLAALAAAVRLAPEKPDVLDAVERFLFRPLEAEIRVSALTTIRQSGVNSVGVRMAVFNALDDPNAKVKETAISVLTRMGPEAIADAALRLESLAGRADESERVKAAARDALRSIGK